MIASLVETAPRRLIIEGTDGVGKTTIAQRIAAATGRPYVHTGPPTKDNWAKEYVQPHSAYDADDPRGDVVLDRWHLGEAIWPAYFGRQSLFKDTAEVIECSNRLADRGFVCWVITRPSEEILLELLNRGERDGVLASISAQTKFIELARVIRTQSRLPIAVIGSDHLMEVESWA